MIWVFNMQILHSGGTSRELWHYADEVWACSIIRQNVRDGDSGDVEVGGGGEGGGLRVETVTFLCECLGAVS